MNDLDDLRGPAFRTFFGLAKSWGLSEEEQSGLLGHSPDLVELWRQGAIDAAQPGDVARVALFLGIYRALHTIFSNGEQADAWPRRVHVTGPLKGSTALDYMLKEGLPGLKYVHTHLTALLH